MAQGLKFKKMNELERAEEIIFKHGGRQVTKKEIQEIQNKKKIIKNHTSNK
jgi:hypothetical protein